MENYLRLVMVRYLRFKNYKYALSRNVFSGDEKRQKKNISWIPIKIVNSHEGSGIHRQFLSLSASTVEYA